MTSLNHHKTLDRNIFFNALLEIINQLLKESLRYCHKTGFIYIKGFFEEEKTIRDWFRKILYI